MISLSPSLESVFAPDTNDLFSFIYSDKKSADLLPHWARENRVATVDGNRTLIETTWTDPATGLKVTREAMQYGAPWAVDWVLYFENTSSQKTPILRDVLALDTDLCAPIEYIENVSGELRYTLHKMLGAPSTPDDFKPTLTRIHMQHEEVLRANGGASSNGDFPFFKIETRLGSIMIGIGWSGQWRADITCPDNARLHISAGMEKMNLSLEPGEKIRSPRILTLLHEGETLGANQSLRKLLNDYYIPQRTGSKQQGKTSQPLLFCNTAYTYSTGGWLNECNEQNQIAMIRALAPLGIEAVITDAGWFDGGWPNGPGNLTMRKEAYPNGAAPVAKAARDEGIVYGLWFEPERVVNGTWIHQNHPEWILKSVDPDQHNFLLNFGLPEVRDYMFGVVSRFMSLPGLQVYRQDFNMNPLSYWVYNDAPDRQGMTEIRYIEGIYAYWDMLAKAFPNSIREECSGGGRRMDLETLKRFHLHQISDYHFDDLTNQARISSLSQYFPNNTIVIPMQRLTDYSLHSSLPSSLLAAWTADAPDFDTERARIVADKYLQVRHLLTDEFYPALPYSMDESVWMASQYHRPDLDEGLLLAFRRAGCKVSAITIPLRGIDERASYEIRYDSTGLIKRVKGSALAKGLKLILKDKPSSEMIVYKKV